MCLTEEYNILKIYEFADCINDSEDIRCVSRHIVLFEKSYTMELGATTLHSSHASTTDGANESNMARLAQLLRAYTPYDGRFPLRVPGVYALRASRITTELVHTTYHPSLCIVAQGAKRLLLGQEVYEYDVSRLLIVSIDLPVASQVLRASSAEPFLAIRLDLDPARIAELVLKIYPQGTPQAQDKRAVYVGRSMAQITDAVIRLVETMADAGDAELIAPLIIDEILIRLLRSSVGDRVAMIGLVESNVHKIGRAVDWVRANYAQPIHVEELAELAHMSVSSFHQHFKAVTSMSPVQYQKVLRLQEARRLMMSAMLDAGAAARHVGYLSASQFSREYSRFFGSAPIRDVRRLREADVPAEDVAR
ncbi:MAG: AraC family transcriptional regulator [Roseiflexaceae bacterium]